MNIPNIGHSIPTGRTIARSRMTWRRGTMRHHQGARVLKCIGCWLVTGGKNNRLLERAIRDFYIEVRQRAS
jgi:hypothetical protein